MACKDAMTRAHHAKPKSNPSHKNPIDFISHMKSPPIKASMKNIIKIHIHKPKLHDEMLQQATHQNIGNPNPNPDSTYRVPI